MSSYKHFIELFLLLLCIVVLRTLTLLLFRECNPKVIATIILHIVSADGNDAVKVGMS